MWDIPPLPDTGRWQWGSRVHDVQLYFQGWLTLGGVGVHESSLRAVGTKKKKKIWVEAFGAGGAVFLKCKQKSLMKKFGAWSWRGGIYEDLWHLSPAAFLLAEKSSHRLPVTLGMSAGSRGRGSEYTRKSKTCRQKKKKNNLISDDLELSDRDQCLYNKGLTRLH